MHKPVERLRLTRQELFDIHAKVRPQTTATNDLVRSAAIPWMTDSTQN
jgi:hypothetical protein